MCKKDPVDKVRMKEMGVFSVGLLEEHHPYPEELKGSERGGGSAANF